MKKIKFSFYNELIFVSETNEFLIYNILNNALDILDFELGSFISSVSSSPGFSLDESSKFTSEILDLINKGYFVVADLDEKKSYQDNYIKQQEYQFNNSPHIGLTVGTTILCNMGCPYCFEVHKPNKSLRDESVIQGIVDYLEDMITNAKVDDWSSLAVIWYGGEPLINKKGLKSLSTRLIQLSENYGIPYSASMISNGLLLDKETWQMLKENKVGEIQITIDGSMETHNKYRPLKTSKGKNYHKILENISMMPEGMSVLIRINTDRAVADSFEELLDDLQSYGIWPQRYDSVKLETAWLRSYEGADVSTLACFSNEEYFDVTCQFRKMQVAKFTAWSLLNNGPIPKLEWKLPERQSDCATYVSPYFFTFDPEGNIHKCWETIHDDKLSSGATVMQHYNQDDFRKYLDYSRTNVHPVCYNCKFNPVCSGLSCAYDALDKLEDDQFPCTYWKKSLPKYFQEMYLSYIENPDKIRLTSPNQKEFQAHAK